MKISTYYSAFYGMNSILEVVLLACCLLMLSINYNQKQLILAMPNNCVMQIFNDFHGSTHLKYKRSFFLFECNN